MDWPCGRALENRIRWSGGIRVDEGISGGGKARGWQKASSRLETSVPVTKFRGTVSCKIYSPRPPKINIFRLYIYIYLYISKRLVDPRTSFYISNPWKSTPALILITRWTITAIVAILHLRSTSSLSIYPFQHLERTNYFFRTKRLFILMDNARRLLSSFFLEHIFLFGKRGKKGIRHVFEKALRRY